MWSRLTYVEGSRCSLSSLRARCFSTRLNGSVGSRSSSAASSSSNPSAVSDVTGSSQKKATPLLRGMLLDHAVDLRNVRTGDHLDIPYELTITEALQDFWFAAFFDQSRIHTSRPFCRQMGLQDRVLPFALAVFLTSSMSHADAAKVQVGFGRVSYLWPLFSGDTVTKSFTVNAVRNTSDGNHSVIHFTCDLKNQRGRLCMRADKRMLFQFPVNSASNVTMAPSDEDEVNIHLFRDHLLSKGTTAVLAEQPSHSLTRFEPGQLILHSLHRTLTFAQSQQLASLARLTHSRHFDTRRYDRGSEILIPGGLVLGLTLSASARDFHEVLHEEIVSCSYNNALHPDTDIVGAVSYVSHVDDSLPGDLELVTVTTLGVKNVHARTELVDIELPLSLFTPGIYSKEMEQICKEWCPMLSGKIVVQVTRKLVRQANHKQVFLL